jgi:hypothetical protein
MNAVDLLIERSLGNLEEKGTGIFVKHLRNGDIYTCRCPTCRTYHGGYRDFVEAQAHLKCRRCNRNAVEKLKKEVAKVDEPETPQKNLFQHPLKKPRLIEGSDEFSSDEEDIKSILGATDDVYGPQGEVTKEVCLNASFGDEFYLRDEFYANGFPKRVRVSGRCKTWATRPDEFRLPVKYGMYQSFYITHANASQFSTIPLGADGEPL